MIVLILMLASATTSIDSCAAAVHQLGKLPAQQIADACKVEPDRDRLWTGDGEPAACVSAKQLGGGAADMGDLPSAMIAGIVADFDKRVAACKNPPPPSDPTKDRTTAPRLWD